MCDNSQKFPLHRVRDDNERRRNERLPAARSLRLAFGQNKGTRQEAKLRSKERSFGIISKSAAMPNPRRAMGGRANGLNTLACFSVHGGVVGAGCQSTAEGRVAEEGGGGESGRRGASRTLSPTV